MLVSVFKTCSSASFATSIASLEQRMINIIRRPSKRSYFSKERSHNSGKSIYRINISGGMETSTSSRTLPCNTWCVMRSTTICWNKLETVILYAVAMESSEANAMRWLYGGIWHVTIKEKLKPYAKAMHMMLSFRKTQALVWPSFIFTFGHTALYLDHMDRRWKLKLWICP